MLTDTYDTNIDDAEVTKQEKVQMWDTLPYRCCSTRC